MKLRIIQNLLFLLCIILTCVTRTEEEIHVSGYEGRDINVSCPYEEGNQWPEKYLCKDACGNDDILITTTEEKKGRYSIHDDKKKQVFTVTISDFNRTDVGIYWCGVTRTGWDAFPANVQLEVVPDICCDQTTKVQSHEESSVSITCQYESEHQNNLKYICRGNQPSTCLEKAIITSDKKLNGQFRLAEDKVARKFSVTIASLTQTNSGPYLCGVHKNTGLDVFTAFELEVKEWCCVKSNKLSGIVGHPVTLQCPYPPQHKHNRKFLCEGDHRSNCTDMVTSQSRFTLQDDASSCCFVVMITELRAGDAGMYWCGSDSQWSVGNYTKIQLSVVFPQQTSTVISTITVVEPVGSQSTHIPEKQIEDAAPIYIVVFIAPAVLLVLTFVLVLVYRCICCKVRGAGASVSRNKTRAAQTEDVIYANQDVALSKL